MRIAPTFVPVSGILGVLLTVAAAGLRAWHSGPPATADPSVSAGFVVVPAVSREQSTWRDVPCPHGRAEFTVDHDSQAKTDLLISTFSAPRTVTRVRIQLSCVSEASVGTPAPWNPVDPMPHAGDPPHPEDRLMADEISPGNVTRTVFWPTSAPGQCSSFTAQPVRCRELCRGGRTAVFWDDTAIDAGAVQYARDVIALLEGSLLPRVEDMIGSCEDVDGDGRLMIAVSPRLHCGTSGPSAFVRAADLQPDGEAPWSNRADVIYLAPHVPLPKLSPILAHELAHIAQFSQWRCEIATPWPLPDWLLEGQAHAAEVHFTGCWSNLEPRLNAFCERPEACPLVIDDAAAAGRWRDPGSRGATAAFCLWLTQRYGAGWWRDMSQLALDDETGWNRMFSRSFAALYREWTISLAVRPAIAERSFVRSVGPQVHALQPRRHVLHRDSTTMVSLTGTATAYCQLPTGCGVRIAIDSGTTPLQLTLVRHNRESDVTDVPTSALALRR